MDANGIMLNSLSALSTSAPVVDSHPASAPGLNNRAAGPASLNGEARPRMSANEDARSETIGDAVRAHRGATSRDKCARHVGVAEPRQVGREWPQQRRGVVGGAAVGPRKSIPSRSRLKARRNAHVYGRLVLVLGTVYKQLVAALLLRLHDLFNESQQRSQRQADHIVVRSFYALDEDRSCGLDAIASCFVVSIARSNVCADEFVRHYLSLANRARPQAESKMC